MSDNIEYKLNADPTGFTAAMERVRQSTEAATKQIQEGFKKVETSLNGVKDMFGKVTAAVGALTAVAAGGKAFKEVIGAANEWTGESKKLATQLGLTTERASVMLVAMRHMGMDTDVVTGAAAKLSKQVFSNGQAFEKLGVQVKDSAGQYRPTMDIMQEVNAKLRDIKNPIEQNIAGMQVYGKSWGEVRGVLRLTKDEITAAEQKAKDLGLVVGDESVANSKKYKEAMADLKIVGTSLEVQFGAAVMPAFVKLGSWLSAYGPAATKLMGEALDGLGWAIGQVVDVATSLWEMVAPGFQALGQVITNTMGVEAPRGMQIIISIMNVLKTAFIGLKTAVLMVMEYVRSDIEITALKILRFADAAMHAMKLDFTGAKKAWDQGGEMIQEATEKRYKNLVKIAQDSKDAMEKVWSSPGKKQPEIKDKTIGAGPTYDFDKEGAEKKEKSRIHEWEARLAKEKEGWAKQQEIAGTAREFSHEQELEYWRKLLTSQKMTAEERAQVEKKFYQTSALIRKEHFEQEIAGERVKLEQFKNNHDQRLTILNDIYKKMVSRYGEESKEAKAAMAEIVKERRAAAEQIDNIEKTMSEGRRAAALAGIDAEEQAAQFAVDTHRMTAEELLTLQQGFEDRRYQIKLAALKEQEALQANNPDSDPVALAQLHNQIEQLEQQHQLKMSAIRNKQFQEQNKNQLAMIGTIESGMQRVIAGTLTGSIRMSNIMQNMMSVVAGAVVDMIAKMAAQWIMQHLIMKGVGSAMAAGEVTSQAGVAGAAAIASTAAIPVIGPAMALEAGAAASAAALSFLPMASAAGGYDIPAGLNPVVQTHAQEMILPAKYANLIRGLAENGGAQAGAGGAGVVVNYHDNSGRLSESELRRNAAVIQRVLNDQRRKS